MKILCVFGQHNYGDPARGEGVEYTHFLPALKALGHEVFFFESYSRVGYRDFTELNRSLLETFERLKPDLVFTVLMIAEVWLDTVGLLRRAGCPVLNWSTDDSWKYAEFSRLIASSFDLYATTCPDALALYARDGVRNVALTQWAASAQSLAPPMPARQCAIDLCFIGAAYGSRSARVNALRAAGMHVECYGHGWANGPVAAERIPELLRGSKVCLNFSEAGGGEGRQIKARVFEVTAAGGMLLTENAPHLGDYFDLECEIAVFDDEEEMVRHARTLLDQPERRDTLARAAHVRVVREHTYEQRLHRLLAGIGIPAGVTKQVDWAAFERCAARHRTGPGLRLLRVLLLLPCLALWGNVRGPRAARRILFEVSWRFLGRHTYTAAGWPGRLFYVES